MAFDRIARSCLVLALALSVSSCAIIRGKGRTPRWYSTDSGLRVLDVGMPSTELVAKVGDEVTIDYEMRVLEGEVVDSSIDRGKPVTFILGDGVVPAGLEEGLLGLPVMGRRRLRVPAALGYGAAGRPPRVPPDSVLVIAVELLAINGQGPPPRTP